MRKCLLFAKSFLILASFTHDNRAFLRAQMFVTSLLASLFIAVCKSAIDNRLFYEFRPLMIQRNASHFELAKKKRTASNRGGKMLVKTTLMERRREIW